MMWNSSKCSPITRPECSTNVSNHDVLAGAGGSKANCKSPIFIFPSQTPLTIVLSKQMHRTNFSQPPRTLNQAPHLTFQSLMVLSDDPLATSWSLCWRQAMPLLCPFRVQTNSQVLMLQSLRVLSPEADMTYLIIKVYYTVSSTGAKDKAYSGISGRSHVPHNNEVVLGTGHHQSIAEALSGIWPHCGGSACSELHPCSHPIHIRDWRYRLWRASHNGTFIILETKDRVSVPH